MKVTGLWMGLAAIVIGILILVAPGVMQWVLGIGFIVVGILAILRK
jgi:membrane protein implicated in regulation of membrane protease activity